MHALNQKDIYLNAIGKRGHVEHRLTILKVCFSQEWEDNFKKI